MGLIAGFVYTRFPYKLGLDVKGGVRFVYQMDTSKLTPDQKTNLPGLRELVQGVLVNRATGSFGVAEPVIVPKGEDQFVVEVPGFTNIDEARSIIGTSARIEFYHARNLVSRGNPNAPYDEVKDTSATGNPVVDFRRTGDATGKIIKPKDPEYAQIIKGWSLILSGDDLKDAKPQPTGSGGYQPVMTFSTKGAAKMEDWTRRNQNVGAMIASVLDGKVLSVAALQDNTVLSDNAVITGEFSAAYVKSLTDLLEQGALPVDLKELSSEKVDPTIGSQALDRMVKAGAISLGVILVFLLAYYALPGVVAAVGLGLYILFTLAALKLMGATFSLAAIAGFILSVGMAVDANILVFERFKEEMKAGRTLVTGLELGFKRAISAIFDSNACTILTSLVLVVLGTGPVKGFAITLIIGVLISFFTAVTVTRSLLMFLVGSGVADNPKLYAMNRNWFGEKFEKTANEKPLRILEKSKLWFGISLLTIIVGIPFVFCGGLKGNVEFRGGYETELSLQGTTKTQSEIAADIEKAGIHGGNVKVGGEGEARRAIVTVPPETGNGQANGAKSVGEKLAKATGLKLPENGGSVFVGPAIQKETIRNAIVGVIVSSGLITLFLAFRFGFGVGGFASGLRFGFSAIGALLHDILVVLGITAMVGYAYGWEVSTLFLTSMLTVIGFSVHDTVIIFDRIRENLHRPLKDENFEHLVNRSITQSFARSINTSMTVVVTLAILLFAGTTTPDLKLFCVTMLAGIVSGTYSSIYNASPILWLWDRAVGRRKGEGATLMGLSRAHDQHTGVVATQAGGAAVVGSDGRSYGQVRRRASAVEKSKINIDDL
ncbi:protein translocase subunit SecDF [soil metagenome]